MTVLSKAQIATSLLDLDTKKAFLQLVTVSTVAGTGTDNTNAAQITQRTTAVTLADGTVGVVLPKAEVSASCTIVNTVSNQTLKVYPDNGSQINALTVTTGAFSLVGGARGEFVCDANGHWYVAAANLTGTSTSASTAELDKLAGVTPGTVTASKALVVDASSALDLLKFGAIGALDASLDVNGLAAAQGGSITLTGGTSSTAGNVGGVVALVGGTPGSTSAGAAVTVTGAAGGSASGAGGAVTLKGGVGTAGNAAGGAAELIGGLGQGSAAGGAITVTSGAAGATGVAGAVNIAVGAATSGNGSAVTITGGNGAGGTNAGGNVNLVPGTAVSTGIPGEVQVNGAAGTFEVTYTAPLMTTVVPASGTAQPFYIATRAVRVKRAYASVVTHGTSETFAITKDATTVAPGAGTNVLAAAITISANNAPVTQAAVSTIATATMAAGDRLSFLVGGTVGAAAGLTITVLLVPV